MIKGRSSDNLHKTQVGVFWSSGIFEGAYFGVLLSEHLTCEAYSYQTDLQMFELNVRVYVLGQKIEKEKKKKN